jgi:hypothetical protein
LDKDQKNSWLDLKKWIKFSMDFDRQHIMFHAQEKQHAFDLGLTNLESIVIADISQEKSPKPP